MDELSKNEVSEPAENCRPWEWDRRRSEAALLLAQQELTDVEIADIAKVSVRQLGTWKKRPEFAERVKQIAKDIGDVMTKYAIARKVRRIKALDDRVRRMQTVIAERAEASEMQSVPGGKTGLMTHDVKSVGSGDYAKQVDIYRVDTALLKEMREHEKQAAQETGQWVERNELSGPDGKAVPITVIEVIKPVDVGESPPNS